MKKILVVSGYCPQDNHSAALSHNAYIEGLIKLGYHVDLLCYSPKGFDIDSKIHVPQVENMYEYDGLSLYEKLSKHKTNEKGEDSSTPLIGNSTENDVPSGKAKLLRIIKKNIRAIYGVYNPSIIWYYRAKHFKSSLEYDYVISMSYPQVSHLLAKHLIQKKHVICGKWIQLWEDPWAADLGNSDGLKKCLKPENELLNASKDIVYVTPITLLHQQELFPANKTKMRWCPLAAYYQADVLDYSDHTENYYGYFGDYSPSIRNLEPFYNVAVEKKLHLDICGSPSNLFVEQDNIHIFPRLPLNELSVHENKANIVICLFNLGGGQIPGKIYQLAATNKTILAILDGPEDEQKIIREYFEKFNRFVFCQNNEQSISQAIDKIETGDLDDISNEPIDAFSVEKVAKKLLGD